MYLLKENLKTNIIIINYVNAFSMTFLKACFLHFRMGDMKLLVGNPGEPSGWIPIPTKEANETALEEEFELTSMASKSTEMREIRLYNITSGETQDSLLI